MEKVKETINNKLNKSAKFLMASDLIYTITALFAETFLVAYFLKITDQNITQIALYWIIVYSLKAVLQLVMGKFIKTNPSIRTKILSLGIVIRALFIMFIFILGDNLATNFVIVAIFCGISETLYWSTHELLFVDVTTNSNRKDYTAIKQMLSTVIKIVAPIVLGSSIELYSFSKIAIYIFALSVIQIFLSLKIKPEDFSTDNNGSKYNIINYISMLKMKKPQKLIQFYKTSFAFGIVRNVPQTLVTIVTIMTFKTSLNLGILTTIFSIFSITSIYIFKKCNKQNSYRKYLFILSSLMVIGVLGLLLDISKTTLIIYSFANAVSIGIFDAAYNTQKGNLIKICNVEKYNVEHIIIGEQFTEYGRVVGFTLMLIAGIIGSLISFKILLLLATLCVPIFTKLLISVDEKAESKS